LSIQAGFRVNYWQNSNITTLDPRLALKYYLTENIALKGAFGIFTQNLRLATQNDFSFFDTWLPTDSTLPLSRSYHYILSLETKPSNGYDLNFDVYYKTLENISELNNLLLQARTASDVFFIGNAVSYGFEVFLQKSIGQFNGWIGYGLGYISATFDSINAGNAFRPKYDRRHDFKIVLNYKLNDRWDFGASFYYQTGQSYTGATSRLQTLPPGSSQGRGIIVPSQRYGLRLPSSHQLNINAIFSFQMFGLDSKLIFDIFNVYNRRDIWFRYFDTSTPETYMKDVTLLPILPTVSIEVRF
jgi:hypothetical protein